MRAVLFDMDGTLVDSEKLWDVAMQQLYAKFGAVMTPEVRESTVGGSAESVIRIVYQDLGLPLEEARALGNEFEQNAIVWSGPDAVPKLILLR